MEIGGTIYLVFEWSERSMKVVTLTGEGVGKDKSMPMVWLTAEWWLI